MLRHTLLTPLLALSLLLSTAVAATADELPPGGTFTDDNGNIHEGYIEAIAAEGVTSGCADDRFCPAEDVTRGQMAVFLVKALSLPSDSTDRFTDDDGSMFESAIQALAAAGITQGCNPPENDRFCPDRAVSRGEMAVFLRKGLELPYTNLDYFRDDDGHMFEADINAIAEAGITKGCNPPDNDHYCVGDGTRRDEMATFLGRAFGYTPIEPPSAPSGASPEEAVRYWFPENFDDAWRVAECESTHNPSAVNPNGYHGMFQIGERYHRDRFEEVTGERWDDAIYTAFYNAQYARWLYEDQGWKPWTCKP